TRVVNGRTVRTPRSAATIAVRLAAAKALYRALRHVGATNADPFHDLRPPVDQAAPESKREAYTASEVRTLLAAAEPLDRAFIHLCATAGLRVSEATSLTWGQVRFEQGILAGVVGKGRRVRDVPAAADLLAALRAVRGPGWTPDEPVLPFGPAAARRR